MKTDGYIEITAHYDLQGGGVERYDFEWMGGDVARISHAFLMTVRDVRDDVLKYRKFPKQPGDRFKVGPFGLRVLEREEWSLDIIAIRERNALTSLRYYWHRCSKLLDTAYRRLIITASVWGLAHYEAAMIPCWRDVHALRYLVERRNYGTSDS
jgi:hypothetical protein